MVLSKFLEMKENGGKANALQVVCLDWSYYSAQWLERVRGSACSYDCSLLATGARLEKHHGFLSQLLFPSQSHVCLTTRQTLCVVGQWSSSFMSWE